MMGGEGLDARDEGRDPQRELHREAARAALSRCSTRARTARVAHECIVDPRALKASRRHRGRGHRQAADGLRLPRADGVVPGGGHADDRADGERVEGGARPLLRRADRDPRGDSRDRAAAIADRDGQSAQARAAHAARAWSATTWTHAYTREKAAFPAPWTREHKFWPAVGRVESAYGDRNLVCSCLPTEAYAEALTVDGQAESDSRESTQLRRRGCVRPPLVIGRTPTRRVSAPRSPCTRPRP